MARSKAIRAWSVASCYSPVERAVLAYTDCLVLEGGRVPDDVFEALRAELNDTEILELTYITCTYAMHATMSRALRLEYDDVDDPITEVPAPEGAFLYNFRRGDQEIVVGWSLEKDVVAVLPRSMSEVVSRDGQQMPVPGKLEVSLGPSPVFYHLA